jgi:hypothetical protein
MFDLFIKRFEKEVTEAQQRIEQIRAMERYYNATKAALEATRLPNDTVIAFHPATVKVTIKAVKTDLLATFDRLCEDVGRRLLEVGLHRDGVPATRLGGYWHQVEWSWLHFPRASPVRQVIIEVDLPPNGLLDAKVTCVQVPTISRKFKVERIERPMIAPPPGMVTLPGWDRAAMLRPAPLGDDGLPF